MTEIDIQQGFEQEARRCEERMPMKLTRAKATEIAASLKDFMCTHGLSQATVWKAIGVSSAKLSRFLSDKYEGDLADMCSRAVNYMDTYARKKRQSKNNGYVQTTVAKRIGTLIKQVESLSDDDEGKIGMVIGDAGHGKSICLREYAKANKNSAYVVLDDTMTSTAMFAEIAKTLRLDQSGSLKSLSKRLISLLEKRSMVIMLDEASSLNVQKLNQLRQIITVQCKCPLILSANSHLLGTINQPVTRRGFESLDQFRSRLTFVLNLDELASASGGGLYTADDIRKLYGSGGIKLTTDAVGTLRKICRTPQTGRLRTCSHIIAALRMSKVVKNGQAVDAVFIVSAIEQLGLPIMTRLPIVSLMPGKSESKEAIQAAG